VNSKYPSLREVTHSHIFFPSSVEEILPMS
jgi:hypothetical protein